MMQNGLTFKMNELEIQTFRQKILETYLVTKHIAE